VRCEPLRDRGNEAAPDEPSQTGVLALVLEQNRMLHKIVADAPMRHREIYNDVITLQAKIVEQQRGELRELYSMLNEAGVEDAETRAKRMAEEERRSEMLQKALGEVGEIGKYALAKYLGIRGLDDTEDDTPQGGEPIQ
jgi:hypothetical protein